MSEPAASPVALITDVTHFVGQSTTQALLEKGARVLCHDDSFVDASERSRFEKECPGAIASKNNTCAAFVEEAMERFGRIDVLINNDAHPAKRAKVDEAHVDDLREALDRLVVRGFELAGLVAPHMRTAEQGRIIFITSAAPLRGLANYSMYATARGAANALVKSLALELAPDNILVNAVAPNFVESPTYFPQELMDDPEVAQKILKNIPLGRLGKQSSIAALVAFLALGESDFLTGQVIPYAGGWA